jgi:hypothetical protein
MKGRTEGCWFERIAYRNNTAYPASRKYSALVLWTVYVSNPVNPSPWPRSI